MGYKIHFYDLKTDSTAQVRVFKDTIESRYGLHIDTYKILEVGFRALLGGGVFNKLVKKGYERLAFGGYGYECFIDRKAINPTPDDITLRETSSFEDQLGLIEHIIKRYEKEFEQQFGVGRIGIGKFHNIDIAYQDYLTFLSAFKKNYKGDFEKFEPSVRVDLISQFQESIRSSLSIADREIRELLCFDDDNNFVVNPQYFEYFSDYLLVGRIYWYEVLKRFGGRSVPLINDFLAFKIKHDHIGNSVNAGEEVITLDGDFFDKHFKTTNISKRLSNSMYIEKDKKRDSFIQRENYVLNGNLGLKFIDAVKEHFKLS